MSKSFLTAREKKILENIAKGDGDPLTAEEKAAVKEMTARVMDPAGMKSKISELLNEANQKIKEACKIAAEYETPFQFKPYGWSGFERKFSGKEAEVRMREIRSLAGWNLDESEMDLDIESFGESEDDDNSSKDYSWEYWSSSSLTC